MVQREATLTEVRFPDPFQPGGRGTSRVLHLVDDPLVDRLRKGDGTLGWSGDNRLALYLDVPGRTWELWRLEHDGVMRKQRGFACDRFSATEVVPAAILWLRQFDVQRGFDPHLDVVAANARVKAEKEKQRQELVAEAAARVEHGLRKDGVL